MLAQKDRSQNTQMRKPSFYYGYIRSLQWKDRRTRYMQKAHWRCERCYVQRANVVHHISYDSLGAEPDQDLMALCWGCHDFMHAWPRTAANDNQLVLPLKETG